MVRIATTCCRSVGKRSWLALLSYLVCLPVWADDVIATLRTVDGSEYAVIRFGSNERNADYHVRVGTQYVALDRVRQLAQVGVGFGRLEYKIILANGHVVDGRVGNLMFDRISFIDPANEAPKTGFAAVTKGRASAGFLFQALNPQSGSVQSVEIANPNDIGELILWDTPVAADEGRLALDQGGTANGTPASENDASL